MAPKGGREEEEEGARVENLLGKQVGSSQGREREEKKRKTQGCQLGFLRRQKTKNSGSKKKIIESFFQIKSRLLCFKTFWLAFIGLAALAEGERKGGEKWSLFFLLLFSREEFS